MCENALVAGGPQVVLQHLIYFPVLLISIDSGESVESVIPICTFSPAAPACV